MYKMSHMSRELVKVLKNEPILERRVKAIVALRGLTLSDVCNQIDLDRGTLSRHLKNPRREPLKYAHKQAIAELLGVPVAVLFPPSPEKAAA